MQYMNKLKFHFQKALLMTSSTARQINVNFVVPSVKFIFVPYVLYLDFFLHHESAICVLLHPKATWREGQSAQNNVNLGTASVGSPNSQPYAFLDRLWVCRKA